MTGDLSFEVQMYRNLGTYYKWSVIRGHSLNEVISHRMFHCNPNSLILLYKCKCHTCTTGKQEGTHKGTRRCMRFGSDNR